MNGVFECFCAENGFADKDNQQRSEMSYDSPPLAVEVEFDFFGDFFE